MVEPPMAACSVVAPNGSSELLGTLGRACSSSMYSSESLIRGLPAITPPVPGHCSWALSIHCYYTCRKLASLLGQSAVHTPLLLPSLTLAPSPATAAAGRSTVRNPSSRPETSSAFSTVVYQRPGDGRGAGAATARAGRAKRRRRFLRMYDIARRTDIALLQ